MSVATKRRFVTKMIASELVLPEKDDKVALILAPRGNNLHEVCFFFSFFGFLNCYCRSLLSELPVVVITWPHYRGGILAVSLYFVVLGL